MHPRSKIEDNKELLEIPNCYILKQPLSEIIGAGDIFIYPDRSSVRHWGCKLEIPSVSYPVDFFFQRLFTEFIFVEIEKEIKIAKEKMCSKEKREVRSTNSFVDFVIDILNGKTDLGEYDAN